MFGTSVMKRGIRTASVDDIVIWNNKNMQSKFSNVNCFALAVYKTKKKVTDLSYSLLFVVGLKFYSENT